MSEAMQLHLKRVHFGVAPVGSALQFKVKAATGAAAKAVLDCDSQELAAWEWAELRDGQAIERMLAGPGTYTLTLMIPFTESVPTTIELEVCVNGKSKPLVLTGQQPDIGKGIAVAIVR